MVDSSNRKTLVVITSNYPCLANSEIFIEPERPYWKGWKEVVIYPARLARVNIFSILSPLFNKEFYKEISILFKSHKFSFHNLSRAFYMLAKSTKIFSEISFIIKKRKLSNFIFYSYWLHSTAITAVRLQRKFGGAAISRVHGIDLYEERSGGYLPYRKFLFENLDAIYPDCIKGQKYMQQKYPLYKDMFTLKYLGSNDHSVAAFERQRDRLNIVSCSNVIPIKRIQLLARALATVDFPVKWIHFGSGSALESLSEEVALLPENISATLAGFTPNSDVLKYYKMHNADVFVHCSETEGMCVSITEANSFGIPIIAADAGGVCEQVFTGKNGFLLPNDFKIEELAEKLSYFFNASDEEIAALRKGAREVWETSFQAEKNFTEFNNMLLNWEDAPRRS